MQQYKIVEMIHDHPLVREVLRNFYFDFIDFCARCMKYQNRGKFGEFLRFFYSVLKTENQECARDQNFVIDLWWRVNYLHMTCG